jgi:multicomponent Na+:H+ antiporter subunit G
MSAIREWITVALMLIGAGFMLLAAIGVLRMPDTYTRMQPATKASTLGAGFMLLAVAVHFGTVGVTMRALAGLVFLVLTAPVAAHMIGRAAYALGVPKWEGTHIDELEDCYDTQSHCAKGQATDKGARGHAESRDAE